MSSGPSCQCEERRKPIEQREWYVYARNHNRSAFSGYHYTLSDYSAIGCRACGARWRSKSAYVRRIPDGRS